MDNHLEHQIFQKHGVLHLEHPEINPFEHPICRLMDVLSARLLATDPGSPHITSLKEQLVQHYFLLSLLSLLSECL